MAVAKGEMEQQNNQSLSELMFSEPMKRATTKLLVSVSVFSFIVSYMSWRSHPFLAFPNQVLSHALDKNYMFLVCNGILVLLAKTSGRLVLRSGPAVSDDLHDGDFHAPPPHAKLLYYSLLHKEAAIESRLLLLQNAESHVVEEEEEEEEKHVIEEGEKNHVIEEEEEENHVIEEEEEEKHVIEDDEEEEEKNVIEEEEEEELEELDNGVLIEEEKEVAEERERLNSLSAEELNKKFEEFIKKMKEEIRVEAQQQYLVLVK